jgi:pyridinium-3,5-bisthiocarboxylic acid mononucleotide nickel chelatase
VRTLYYQPTAGIAGDLHLAALLDLGVPLEHLESELAKLNLSGQFRLEVTPSWKMGIGGTRVMVHQQDQHDHRHYSTIQRIISDAGYSQGVTERALVMFREIAEAESRIHRIDIEKVHFHEVGAIDAIVDIVGSAIALEWLNVDHIVSAAVELGAGQVKCAHGLLPVPAPATQEIMFGVPCTYGGVQGEATTPTGAAILKANVREYLPKGRFTPEKVGYGIGHKDFVIPNVLRVVLGDYEAVGSLSTDTHVDTHFKLEANIDDMTPEAFEPLMQRLFAAGASDVYHTPIIMKKSRSATCLTVLADAVHRDALADLILNESTTIGLRILSFSKRILPREQLTIGTSLGPVRVKQVIQPDGRQRHKIEHEDVIRLSTESGIDYRTLRVRLDREVDDTLAGGRIA